MSNGTKVKHDHHQTITRHAQLHSPVLERHSRIERESGKPRQKPGLMGVVNESVPPEEQSNPSYFGESMQLSHVDVFMFMKKNGLQIPHVEDPGRDPTPAPKSVSQSRHKKLASSAAYSFSGQSMHAV